MPDRPTNMQEACNILPADDCTQRCWRRRKPGFQRKLMVLAILVFSLSITITETQLTEEYPETYKEMLARIINKTRARIISNSSTDNNQEKGNNYYGLLRRIIMSNSSAYKDQEKGNNYYGVRGRLFTWNSSAHKDLETGNNNYYGVRRSVLNLTGLQTFPNFQTNQQTKYRIIVPVPGIKLMWKLLLGLFFVLGAIFSCIKGALQCKNDTTENNIRQQGMLLDTTNKAIDKTTDNNTCMQQRDNLVVATV